MMIQQDQERRDIKDKYQNAINLIRQMTQNYINTIRRIVQHRAQLLSQKPNKQEQIQKFKMEKNKAEQKFRMYKEQLKRTQRDIYYQPKTARQTLSQQFIDEYAMLPDKQKYYEFSGQGIKFGVNPRSYEMIISMYTVRQGIIKFNVFHQKIEKKILGYFASMRTDKRGKSVRELFMEFSGKFEELMRVIQEESMCDGCQEFLKYSEKENLWVGPTVVSYLNGGKYKFYHEVCMNEKHSIGM